MNLPVSRIIHTACLIAVLGVLAAPSLGQVANAPTAPDASPTTMPASGSSVVPPVLSRTPQVSDKTYRLSPEDVVTVSVANFTHLSCQATVQPDGSITVPLVGDVSVIGETTASTARLLANRWKKFVINPSVTVALAQKRPIYGVVFYGHVMRSGNVPFRDTLRLTQALAEMGGIAPKGDASQVVLMRRSGEKLTLDISHPETLAGTPRDIALEEGDVVFIPERRAQVVVLGEVERPGNIDHRENMTVLEALTATGGIKETAELSKATLMHDGKETPLDLEAMLRRADMTLNRTLSPGDRILVPEAPQNRTYVFGAVGRPGYYKLKPGDRLLDALNTFGLSPQASLSNIVLTRPDKVKNTARVQEINLEKSLKKGDLTGNVELQPGDIIFIADKRRKFQIQDVLGLASGLNLLDNTARILMGGLGGR